MIKKCVVTAALVAATVLVGTSTAAAAPAHQVSSTSFSAASTKAGLAQPFFGFGG